MAQLSEIIRVYGCICDVIDHTLERYDGFDLEHYAQDFLVRVGADALLEEKDRPVA